MKEHERQFGFTLIEVIVVLVILGLCAAMAIPMLSTTSSEKLGAAADILAADLEYARNLAITKGQVYQVVFSAGSETYELQDSTSAVIEHPVNKNDYSRDYTDDGPLNGVVIDTVSFDGTATVKFDSMGAPYDGSGGTLNSGAVTLQCGDASMQVNVEPVTGYISITD